MYIYFSKGACRSTPPCLRTWFTDDQTISTHTYTLEELKIILCSEANIDVIWLNDNKMFVNPDKFQANVKVKTID